MRTKKAWHFFAVISCSEVFDYLQFLITTNKAHASGGSVAASFWELFFEIVEVSEQPDKLLRFFLFYGVHKRVMRFFS